MIQPMIAQKPDKLRQLQYPTAIERKYDGFRAFIIKETGDLRLLSARQGIDETNRYPTLISSLRTLPDGMYDGEVYCPRYPGQASARTAVNEKEIKFAIFDIPTLQSPYLLRRIQVQTLPTSQRYHPSEVYSLNTTSYSGVKEILNRILSINYMGFQLYEGVICKPLSSPYLAGERKCWVKLKNKIA